MTTTNQQRTPLERQALGRPIEGGDSQQLHDVIQGLRWVLENLHYSQNGARGLAPLLHDAADRLERLGGPRRT